jgi:predicted RecB family nuclease
MKSTIEGIRLAATDLSNYLNCHHLTTLDLDVIHGKRSAPDWRDPDAAILQERGREHETSYLASLRAAGRTIIDLQDAGDAKAVTETLSAIGRGVEVIAQAGLQCGSWFGRADMLQRVEQPSRLGAWSYEVYDCKLARETKAGTILQLALYSDLLGTAQGLLPKRMYVVMPGNGFLTESYRVLDYAAYYRFVRAQLEKCTVLPVESFETYPDLIQNCEACRWWLECDRMRRHDDHLSLVAGITHVQQKQFKEWNVQTVAQLAKLPLPLEQHPKHGAKESYERLREQARVQVMSREAARPIYEILPVISNQGLTRLPAPSRGDIFFDLESDPFAGLDGREYLFGYIGTSTESPYVAHWALTPANERSVFESFVNTVMATWTAYPDMHVYHFTAYEPAALKRLMGRYATCEDEIDRMLRAGLFVDLYTITRQSVRASVEQYSLKQLEPFHNFIRSIPLEQARSALRLIEHVLELDRNTKINDDTRRTVEGYNCDDCVSTRSLRDWLEKLRTSLIEADQEILRPNFSDGTPSEKIDERQARIAALVARLSADIPADESERTPEQSAYWLLSNILDYHRREAKATWWEYFRLKDLPDEDLYDEKAGIAGLIYQRSQLEGRSRLPTDTYSFPEQETDVREGDEVYHTGQKIGKVTSIDPVNHVVDIKKTAATAEIHPKSVYAYKAVRTDELADALYRLGLWVADHGINAPGPYRSERDLLLRLPPRRNTDTPLQKKGEEILAAAKRCTIELDGGVLPIQGPPGSGKTYIGARVIVDLVRRGKKVGVTAVSHAVIRNLLDEVVQASLEEHVKVAIMHKAPQKSNSQPLGITEVLTNDQPLVSLQRNQVNVVGGTAWLWSRTDYAGAVDVLVVDEAGQMSLANVLAVGQAAQNILLLGDPQQLDQPTQGTHPPGADVSALAHLLGEHETIPENEGLFLAETWRLHPSICSFTSEVFYEQRLIPRRGLARQHIDGHSWLGPAGLWLVPVVHQGNTNSAHEEVDRIAEIVESLIQPSVMWTDQTGHTRQLTTDDILVVAPYNAQVADIASRLHVRVGTVDKFQGQQAPVVIYSLTTSSPEDAPRGMEFLYSRNRLNVALSRARAIVVVVGSPKLFEPECHTPRQIQLANALCRFRELAKTVPTNT